jgi:hypothetical protein
MEGTIFQKSNQSKRILSALFDVRPVTNQGVLDIEKIKQVKAILDLREEDFRQDQERIDQGRILNLSGRRIKPEEFDKPSRRSLSVTSWPSKKSEFQETSSINELREKPLESVLTEAGILPSKEQIIAELEEFEDLEKHLNNQVSATSQLAEIKPEEIKKKKALTEMIANLEEFYFPEVSSQEYSQSVLSRTKEGHGCQRLGQDLSQEQASVIPPVRIGFKSLFGFLITGFLIALVIPGAAWLSQGLEIKEDVLSSSLSAYQNLLFARQSLEQADWQAAEQSFGSAHSDFSQAHQEINKLGRLTLGILERLPGGDLVSSGSHLVKVGESLAQAGQGLASTAQLFSFENLFSLINLPESSSENILAAKNNSLTDLMAASQNDLNQALTKIRSANQELEQVKVEALPEDIQEGVAALKEKLPLAEQMLAQTANYSGALLKILGHDNPRQYLLIFQNNSEIRATGGFIGTYGLLTLDKGVIDELLIDGVFNADGQLHEKIIPPRPIQKISTAWSMHDANWFADFPTSAQKIEWFYEKTGGPTVDGVISFTPTVIERLLELTGPIAMPEYELVLNAENFVELIQYKVEIDYDKELNRPKKILADFAPLFIKRLSQLSAQERNQALEIIFNSLDEKHILIYFNNSSLEDLVIDQGWAGQLLSTDKDYLSVVSSNINGYKTDRVVKETIEHQAEIQEDGSIIDTLTITRQHQGGNEKYDWWNRVNANYLRVYLPLGSQLISAQGQSLEIYQPPIDYQEQGFKTDPLVGSIENKMIIDPKTGTRIFQENNKTVFANWIYVSPGEKVVLTYQYKLPFKINLTKSTDSYSLLAQKQSGSLGSQFSHQIKFPTDWQVSWRHPDQMDYQPGLINYLGDLKVDRFLGVAFDIKR